MQCTETTLFLHTTKLILAGIFVFLFCIKFIEVLDNDIATRFSVEDDTGNFPSLNICPSYNIVYNHSLLINFQDNYTLDDLERLPSMTTLLHLEYVIFKESKM